MANTSHNDILTATTLLSLLSRLPPQKLITITAEPVTMKDTIRDLDALAEVLARHGEEVAVGVRHQRGPKMPMAYISVVGKERRHHLDATNTGHTDLLTSPEIDEESGDARIELEPLGFHEEIPKILTYLHRNP